MKRRERIAIGAAFISFAAAGCGATARTGLVDNGQAAQGAAEDSGEQSAVVDVAPGQTRLAEPVPGVGLSERLQAIADRVGRLEAAETARAVSVGTPGGERGPTPQVASGFALDALSRRVGELERRFAEIAPREEAILPPPETGSAADRDASVAESLELTTVRIAALERDLETLEKQLKAATSTVGDLAERVCTP